MTIAVVPAAARTTNRRQCINRSEQPFLSCSLQSCGNIDWASQQQLKLQSPHPKKKKEGCHAETSWEPFGAMGPYAFFPSGSYRLPFPGQQPLLPVTTTDRTGKAVALHCTDKLATSPSTAMSPDLRVSIYQSCSQLPCPSTFLFCLLRMFVAV